MQEFPPCDSKEKGTVVLAITDIGYRIIDGVDAIGTQMSDTVFGAPIRLGVTGLARSGKTVFITSLVANLLSGAKLPQFAASAQDRIELAYLNPQPNDTIARFDYETHLAKLCGDPPNWPDNTKGISTLRITLKLRPMGMLAGLRGAREQHIDIVDYPRQRIERWVVCPTSRRSRDVAWPQK